MLVKWAAVFYIHGGKWTIFLALCHVDNGKDLASHQMRDASGHPISDLLCNHNLVDPSTFLVNANIAIHLVRLGGKVEHQGLFRFILSLCGTYQV